MEVKRTPRKKKSFGTTKKPKKAPDTSMDPLHRINRVLLEVAHTEVKMGEMPVELRKQFGMCKKTLIALQRTLQSAASGQQLG